MPFFHYRKKQMKENQKKTRMDSMENRVEKAMNETENKYEKKTEEVRWDGWRWRKIERCILFTFCPSGQTQNGTVKRITILTLV